MKTEYTVEIYDGINNEKQTNIFIGIFKKLIRVDKEEKTMLPIIGICFQSKVILPQEILINYSSF